MYISGYKYDMRQFRNSQYWVTEDGIIYAKSGGIYTHNGGGYFKWRPEKLKQVKVYPNHQGYLGRAMFLDGKYVHKRVHQLVAECYIGPCPEGKEVDHIDNDKLNNHYTNLQYLTRQENMAKVEYDKRKPRTSSQLENPLLNIP